MRIIDISLALREGMVVWPGDDPFERTITSAIANGGFCNLSRLQTPAHAGTHVDAPFHFVEGAATIDRIEPDVFVGPCRVEAIGAEKLIEPVHLERLDLEGVERLLLKTSNSNLYDRPEFVEDYVALSPEAARYLASLGSLRLIGIDYYSIGPFSPREASRAVHEAILGRSIVALEGLNLKDVEPGNYELAALPLKIEGGDGSPVRAVLIDRGK